LHPLTLSSDWLDLEMQSYQRENQGLQVLNEIVEYAKSLGVLGFGDIDERTNLGGLDDKAAVSHLNRK
jgi:hypothetical protein